MKLSSCPFRARNKRPSENQQVQREIQRFLLALQSYPGRFAHDPVTFEEHYGSLVRAAASEWRRRL
jgi:hypothetical protein